MDNTDSVPQKAHYPRTEPLALGAAIGCVALYVLLHVALGTDGWPAVVRFPVGLLPALGIGIGIAVELRVVRRIDELQRRIQLEALALGYPTAILVVVAIRFLQTEGFLSSWQLGDIWPLLTAPYFVGLALAWSRYR